MANNYKFAANLYVGKTAQPGTGTGTAEDPYGSLGQALVIGYSGTIAIGTGTYTGANAFNIYNSSSSVIGDGKVLFKGDGTGIWCSIGGTDAFSNIEIASFQKLTDGPTYGSSTFDRVIFRNGEVSHGIYGNAKIDHFQNCLFINAPCVPHSDGQLYVDVRRIVHHCLFFNSPLNTPVWHIPTACYFDASSTLYANSARLPENCNIRGALVIDNVTYANLNEAAVTYPNLKTTLGNFNADPQFNKPESEDFTLRITSPHLNTIIGPRHLRFGTGYYFEQFNGASANDDVTQSNCRLRSTANPLYTVAVLETSGYIWNDQGGLTIKPNSNGNYEGYLLTDKIRIFDRPQRLRTWNVVTGLNFDTDYPGVEPSGTQASANPNVFNNNVPDYTYAAAGSQGRKPNRLTERMRWSSNPNPDKDDPSTWETGINFVEFELDAELSYNPSPLRGNGAPDFNTLATAVQPVIARWIQLQIKTRNNYYR